MAAREVLRSLLTGYKRPTTHPVDDEGEGAESLIGFVLAAAAVGVLTGHQRREFPASARTGCASAREPGRLGARPLVGRDRRGAGLHGRRRPRSRPGASGRTARRRQRDPARRSGRRRPRPARPVPAATGQIRRWPPVHQQRYGAGSRGAVGADGRVRGCHRCHRDPAQPRRSACPGRRRRGRRAGHRVQRTDRRWRFRSRRAPQAVRSTHHDRHPGGVPRPVSSPPICWCNPDTTST